LEQRGKKETKRQAQFEALAEQLRQEIKEKDRERSNAELREGYERQSITRDAKELKEQVEALTQQLEKTQTELDHAR
jgi:hypothetical protein